MRKFAALVPLSAVLLAAGACQAEDASGDESTEAADASDVAVTEPKELPELDPTLPAIPSFDPPAELAENAEAPFPYLLDYDHEAWSYDIAVDGLSDQDRIFITSYLLPEGTEYPDYDSRLGFIGEYDELVANGSHEDSHANALVNGYEGVFRFAIIRDGGPTIYQRNFFLFTQNHVVQLTCQWTDNREIVSPYCGDVQETFEIE